MAFFQGLAGSYRKFSVHLYPAYIHLALPHVLVGDRYLVNNAVVRLKIQNLGLVAVAALRRLGGTVGAYQLPDIIEAAVGDDPTASMSGGVVLRRGDRLAGAEAASYDPEARALRLTGGVRYEDPDSLVLSDSAEFAYEDGHIRFEGAEFEVGPKNARGSASVLVSKVGVW